jgi:hypothetical protein
LNIEASPFNVTDLTLYPNIFIVSYLYHIEREQSQHRRVSSFPQCSQKLESSFTCELDIPSSRLHSPEFGMSNSQVYHEDEEGPPALQDALTLIKAKIASPAPPRICFVQFYVWRISKIDAIAQTFEVCVTFRFSYLEPKRGNLTPSEEGDGWSAGQIKWKPQPRFLNKVEDSEEQEEWWVVTTADFGRTVKPSQVEGLAEEQLWVHQYIRLRGVFEDLFELRSFPFDLQFLTLHITSHWSMESLLFEFSHNEVSSVARMALNSQIFEKHSPQLIDWRTAQAASELTEGLPSYRHCHLLSDKHESRTQVHYSNCHLRLLVSRNSSYVLWNVVSMHLLIGFCCFSVFSIAPADAADRIGLLLTLVLASAAFKLVSTSMLPETPYISAVDKFGYAVMALELCLTAYVSIVPHVYAYNDSNNDSASRSDFVCFLITVGVWCLFLVWFAVTSRDADRRRQLVCRAVDKTFLERIVKIRTQCTRRIRESDSVIV